tara:strand:- start:1161 stop:2030 length:870 start_codon:yes stop_codon:yes gene_type:complete
MIVAVTFALIGAILFAFAAQTQKKALSFLDDLSGTFVSVATIAVVFWLVAIWNLRWEFWLSKATIFFVIAGLLFPAMGQRFQILSVKHVGPTLTSAFNAFLPVFAVVPAILFLGETVAPLQIFGIFALIAGLLLAAFGRGISMNNKAFYLLLLPIGAALARAISQPLTKAGYNILTEPLFAMLVMASVSTAVIGVMVLSSGSPRRIVSLQKGHGLFILNGLLIGAGILALQISLIFGSVSLSASLMVTTPIWTLVLSIFVFKNEDLKWWHGLVTFFVTAGAIMVIMGQQ